MELVAAIVARATDRPLNVYARDKLLLPLGITDFEWREGTGGTPIAAAGLRLMPRDMAKIGLLMLNNGRWEGVQLVPQSWVQASTSTQANVASDALCGTQYGGVRYGYYWWLNTWCSTTTPLPVVQALGNGGQRICLIPDRRMVIVTTAGFYNSDSSVTGQLAADLLAVLPSTMPAP